jgi:hypothetical protein
MRSEYFWRMRSASALRFSKGCSSLNLLRILMVCWKMERLVGCLAGGRLQGCVRGRWLQEAQEMSATLCLQRRTGAAGSGVGCGMGWVKYLLFGDREARWRLEVGGGLTSGKVASRCRLDN